MDKCILNCSIIVYFSIGFVVLPPNRFQIGDVWSILECRALTSSWNTKNETLNESGTKETNKQLPAKLGKPQNHYQQFEPRTTYLLIIVLKNTTISHQSMSKQTTKYMQQYTHTLHAKSTNPHPVPPGWVPRPILCNAPASSVTCGATPPAAMVCSVSHLGAKRRFAEAVIGGLEDGRKT